MLTNKRVIYELYIDKFAHNLVGLTERLPYFSELGINTLWLLPHYPSPIIDGGYDVINYKAVRSDLGSIRDFDEFTKQAAERNIDVFIDLPLNHTSNKHPWFVEARSSKISAKRDWYLWSDDRTKFSEAKNAFPHLKHSNWIKNPKTNDYYFATFYPEQPDLNWDNPQVFDAFTDILQFWINHGVSGFRLDAVSHLIKRDKSKSVNLFETHAIVKKLRSWVDAHASNIVLLAEAGGTYNHMHEFFGDGDECQLVFNFGVSAALVADAVLPINFSTDSYASKLNEVPVGCCWALPVRNHDQLSLSLLPEIDRVEFMTRIDPHGDFSFIRNKGVSMRLASILPDEDVRKRLFTKLFSLQGAVVLYYGIETGMKNQVMATHPTDTREFVRGDFDWLLAQESIENPNSLYWHIKKLIASKQLCVLV
ncbi:hypothetical protein CO180_02540 [candidate division WWE3 bacterium CG_4_9_14_3_um_filter_41_6]|uniref:Glycosyl hydrolase family 13 catalytic domain-containing protein n=1 Tax=candidate division WWE3 bacterium CG_4_10_14_0_2_um_filter_41_14 TaxID=1975072 RepID=A0A2M7TKK4_UNCKA|nr:MAG: hypothetical protein COY32_02675 [candidate division WWE3 bacterium CG_4_10_14_0_2_um_filter_41_14]PJA38776.1 MAG: hypothetical protein CO180_02540 [candidate division WWE3 bacterium CG_4_9_14_3_um_filter_41_6]